MWRRSLAPVRAVNGFKERLAHAATNGATARHCREMDKPLNLGDRAGIVNSLRRLGRSCSRRASEFGDYYYSISPAGLLKSLLMGSSGGVCVGGGGGVGGILPLLGIPLLYRS